jgi:hypothetical protein
MHGGARRRATPTPPVVTTSGKYFVCFGSRADSCTRECHRRATGDVQCICIYLSTPNSSRKVITTLFYFLTYISPFILLESQLNKTKREWRNSPVPDFHATAAWISASSTSISCRQAVSEGRGPSCPRASRGESMSQ